MCEKSFSFEAFYAFFTCVVFLTQTKKVNNILYLTNLNGMSTLYLHAG